MYSARCHITVTGCHITKLTPKIKFPGSTLYDPQKWRRYCLVYRSYRQFVIRPHYRNLTPLSGSYTFLGVGFEFCDQNWSLWTLLYPYTVQGVILQTWGVILQKMTLKIEFPGSTLYDPKISSGFHVRLSRYRVKYIFAQMSQHPSCAVQVVQKIRGFTLLFWFLLLRIVGDPFCRFPKFFFQSSWFFT